MYWQIKMSQFAMYFQPLILTVIVASVMISLQCKLILHKIWMTLDQFGSTSLWLPIFTVNNN